MKCGEICVCSDCSFVLVSWVCDVLSFLSLI